jgi:hypothetical protein
MSGLAVIILVLLNLFGTSPINCQVGSILHLLFLRALIGHTPKAWVSSAWVGIGPPTLMKEHLFLISCS